MGVVLPNRGAHCHNKGVERVPLLNVIARTLIGPPYPSNSYYRFITVFEILYSETPV